MRENRKTPVQPSQRSRSKGTRKFADRYDTQAYGRAIRRACVAAGIEPWAPNRLRHSRGTDLRHRHGLEASQAVLGHSEIGTTQIYAERDHDAARRIMSEVG